MLRFLVLATALAGGTVLARLVVMPLVAQYRVRAILTDAWAGDIHLDADLDFAGNITLRDLRLDDLYGRTWLHVPRATLQTKGWKSLSWPTLKTVTAEVMELNLYLEEGRFRAPVKALLAGSLASQTVRDIEAVLAGNLTVRVVRADDRHNVTEYPGLHIDVSQPPGEVRFHLLRANPDTHEDLRVDGSYQTASKTLDAEIHLVHKISPGEAEVAVDLLALKELSFATGELSLAASLRGPVDQLPRIQHAVDLELGKGRVRLTDGTVFENIALGVRAENGHGTVRHGHVTIDMADLSLRETPFAYDLGKPSLAVKNVDATVELSQHEPRGKLLSHWVGRVSGEGYIHTSGTVEYAADRKEPLSAQLQLRAEKLAAAYRTEPPNRPLTLDGIEWKQASLTTSAIEIKGLSVKTLGGVVQGDLTARDFLAERGRTELTLSGTGLRLDEVRRSLAADVKALPSGGNFGFKVRVTGPQQHPLDYSGGGEFAIDHANFWSVPLLSVTFGLMKVPQNPTTISDAEGAFEFKAGIATIQHAVIANPVAGVECTGGTINLHDGAVDLYIVGGNFLTMNAFTRPLLKDVKNLLFAQRVRGNWNNLTNANFVPIPGANIPDASVTLVVGLAKAGGDLRAGIGSIFQGLFNLGPRKK